MRTQKPHEKLSFGGVHGCYVLPLLPKPIPTSVHTYAFAFHETTSPYDNVFIDADQCDAGLGFLPVTVTAETAFSFKQPSQPAQFVFGHEVSVA
jgi:hypothetical protein